MFRVLGWVLLLASTMSWAWAGGKPGPLPAEAFGLHFHGIVQGRPWPSVQFGFLRLWDAGVTWTDLQPSRGEWRFERLDRYVAEAREKRVQLLLTLGQTPAWAASDPQARSPYGPGGSSAPASLEDWREYVRTLAKRYNNAILTWEVWNEINVPHFYRGDFGRMAEMERIAVEVLKAENPKNVVLTPSIQGGAFGKLDAYFAAGGGRHADGISYHFYAVTETPEALPERIRRVRQVMTKHGLGSKPLWNTEMGWLIPDSLGQHRSTIKPAWRNWRRTTMREAPGFIMQSYLLSLNGGIRHIFWYAWDNQFLGLAENQGRDQKPAAKGYIRAYEWLVGAVFEGCESRGGVWTCRIQRDGRRQWILWAPEDREFVVPSEWRMGSMRRIDTNEDGAVPDSLTLDSSPILIKP